MREQREKELKEKFGVLFLTMLLICLCFPGFSSVSYASEHEYREAIMASAFIVIHPGELRLCKNIHLIFDGVNPPINTSITALNDRFRKLRCSLDIRANGLFIDFDVYFELGLGNETASLYTDEIAGEFLKAFNYSDVSLTSKKQAVRNGEIWVYRSFRVPKSREGILTFLKFAPSGGFSKYIDNLIERYYPGDSTTCLSPEYWLTRKNSKLHLLLVVTGICSDLLPSWDLRDFQYTLSVKELLNTDHPIVEQPLDYQQVIVEVETNHTELLSRGITSYIVNIDDIEPEGYNIIPKSGWPYWVEIVYEHLSPMDDVIVRMNINSHVKSIPNPKEPLIRIGIALIVILSILLIVLIYIGKKGKEVRSRDRKDFQQGV
ncbi:MAG: hypothetical protein QXK33_04975 [Candidatus Bathyarchaeia archaeon]